MLGPVEYVGLCSAREIVLDESLLDDILGFLDGVQAAFVELVADFSVTKSRSVGDMISPSTA